MVIYIWSIYDMDFITYSKEIDHIIWYGVCQTIFLTDGIANLFLVKFNFICFQVNFTKIDLIVWSQVHPLSDKFACSFICISILNHLFTLFQVIMIIDFTHGIFIDKKTAWSARCGAFFFNFIICWKHKIMNVVIHTTFQSFFNYHVNRCSRLLQLLAYRF